MVTRGLDQCLFVYPPQEWQALADKLATLPLTQSDARAFVRLLFSGATECELDKQGRILLPPHLRQYAGIDRKWWSSAYPDVLRSGLPLNGSNTPPQLRNRTRPLRKKSWIGHLTAAWQPNRWRTCCEVCTSNRFAGGDSAVSACRPGRIYVDGTLGGGGHAERILSSAPNVLLVGIDKDPHALAAAAQRPLLGKTK